MGEWKRIYGNPGRLLLFGLLLLVSIIFFLISRMDYFGRGSMSSMLDSERYYSWLVSQIRGRTEEESKVFLEEEYKVASDYLSLRFRQKKSEEADRILSAVMEREYFVNEEEIEEQVLMQRLLAVYSRIEELEEEIEYLSGYSSYLDKIQTQAKLQSQTALFGNEKSFAHRNLVRTAEEFDTMRDVETAFAADRAYTKWLDYELADYLYLILIVIFVLAFFEERKAGLWGTVRASRGGRIRLGLKRALILASAAVLGTVMIYGVNLLISLSLSGGFEDMGKSIQSLADFKTLPMHLTIGQWIVQYLFFKAASGFMVGLILWCILGSLSNAQFILAVLGIIVTVEYVLFTYLPVQSILNPLKYFNLFSYIRTSKLYTEYLNIDLFGYPVGIRRLAFFALPVLTVLFFLWAMLMQHRRRPEGNKDILSGFVGAWDRFADFFRRRLSIGGWELYKTLIYQKGILLLFVIYFAGGSLVYLNAAGQGGRSDLEQAYLRDLLGPVDEKRAEEYFIRARENAQEDQGILSAIDRVEAHVYDVIKRAEEGGYEPWIVFSETYEGAYGPASIEGQRISTAAAMVFLIACCAATVAYERQSGTVYMLRSLKRGRRGVFVRRLFIAFLMTVFVWAVVYIREFYTFLEVTKPASLASAIGNFDALARFPFPVTIGQFLMIIHIVRLVMLYFLAIMVICISERVQNVMSSYIVSIALLGLPALLFSLGMDSMRYISPILAISSAEGMWTLGMTGSFLGLIPCMVWLVIGIAALVFHYQSWVYGEGNEIKVFFKKSDL